MADLIAIDWGLSSFRMYLIGENGEVQRRFSSDSGVLMLPDRDFKRSLRRHLREFGSIPADIPKIASGMITSNRGWCETPYVTCPAAPEDLAEALVRHEMEELGTIWFVPGVDQMTPEPDIMRGEETQIAGLAVQDTVTAILPGTHSKWASLSPREIIRFKTFMTGELYAILMEHSILCKTAESSWSDVVFKEGVQSGYSFRNQHKGLLSELFQVRVKTIQGDIGGSFVASYVSGLLLGCEIADAVGSGFTPDTTKHIIGEKRLAGLYHVALAECSISAEIVEDDITAAGLYRIARAAQLV